VWSRGGGEGTEMKGRRKSGRGKKGGIGWREK